VDLKQFSQIKYDHGESVPLPSGQAVAICLVLAAGVALAIKLPPVLIPTLIVVLILGVARPARRLHLGPRYLICGSEVFYYGNVRRLTIDQEKGRLHIESNADRILVIDRTKFPTNARKPEKIAAHQRTRFDKVTDKVVKQVQRAVPTAEIRTVEQAQARTV
jgi:hypothetical protein